MAEADGDGPGQGDLQAEGRDGGVRQRPGAQSRPAAIHGPRPREGQVRRDVVRHRPEHGAQFRSPTATGMITCSWLHPTRSPNFFTTSESSVPSPRDGELIWAMDELNS